MTRHAMTQRAVARLAREAARARARLLALAVERMADIAYGPLPAQRLDLYRPRPSRASPLPVVLRLHGGGWRSGDKTDLRALDERMARRGLLVVSANYRLSDEAIFPAQLDDARAAVSWIEQHAAAYGGDARRLSVWGHSAGGHLAALLGTTGAVKRVCTVSAPFERADLARTANPLTYLRDDCAPRVLAIHGDQDEMVPYGQLGLWVDGLRAVNATVETISVPGGGHMLESWPRSARRAILRRMEAFFLAP